MLKEYKNIILHNSKDDLYILYKCLLKIHQTDDKISNIIFKTINIKIKNIIFNNYEYEDNKIDICKLLDEYYYVINKEKELLSYRNIIENKFRNILKNKDYIIINNKKIMFKEMTFKDFVEENTKEKKYKKLYITNI